MTGSRRSHLGFAFGILILVANRAGAADLAGFLSVGGGYLENPLGVAWESEAGFLSQNLQLAYVGHRERDRFKLGWETAAFEFGNDTDLGSLRNGLGWEWLRPSLEDPGLVGAGLQVAWKSYRDRYAYYDHQDLDAYLTLKTYPLGNLMARAVATFRYRRYPDLPEEGFIEPRLNLELKRFSAGGTMLGLDVNLGAKKFYDSAASSVWETPNLPSTSQLATRLNFSRSLGDRLGLRAWAEARFSLEEFPHYVGEDVYDSPLLDLYAHEGFDGLFAIKWLVPGLFWLEPGLAYGDHDYGELQFAGEDGGASRRDTIADVFLNVEKTFTAGSGRLRWRSALMYRDQDSTLDAYRFSGLSASSTLTYFF